ncbi:hypothetical protein CALCODRAFT_504475 [Calocera cornea HHB12733]|uniref:Uncharacterized protein n=1 Tax=Calocera cornea HHB12733 TaxID=1353952 RepID=A0A165CEC7_9BASI|nr:hypothetical protein CALCODRAFT_504475 [Calocera cornea HHB12733]
MLKAPSFDKLPTARSPTKVQFSIPATSSSPTKPSFKSVKSIETVIDAWLDAPYSPFTRSSPFRQPTYWADLFIITATCALAGFRTAPLWLAWGVPCVANLSLSFGDRASSDRREFGPRKKWLLLEWLTVHVIIHLMLALMDRRVSRRYSINTLPRDAFLVLVLACAVATRLFYYYQSLEQAPSPPAPPVLEKAKKGKMNREAKEAQVASSKEKEEEKRWAQARRRTIMGYENRPNFERLQNKNDNTSMPQTPTQSPVWEPLVRFLGLHFVADNWTGNGDVQVEVKN